MKLDRLRQTCENRTSQQHFSGYLNIKNPLSKLSQLRFLHNLDFGHSKTELIFDKMKNLNCIEKTEAKLGFANKREHKKLLYKVLRLRFETGYLEIKSQIKQRNDAMQFLMLQ